MTARLTPTLLRPAWPLAACLVVALFWPATDVWYAEANVRLGHRPVWIHSGPGYVTLIASRPGTTARPWSASVRRLDPIGRKMLSIDTSRVYSAGGDYYFTAPLWLVSTAAGLFAGMLLVSRWRRPLPDVVGRCRRCGYDLRASRDRCPECGTVVDQLRPIT